MFCILLIWYCVCNGSCAYYGRDKTERFFFIRLRKDVFTWNYCFVVVGTSNCVWERFFGSFVINKLCSVFRCDYLLIFASLFIPLSLSITVYLFPPDSLPIVLSLSIEYYR
jgi:hypothetical protein